MLTPLLRRTLGMLTVLAVMSALIFALIGLMPGDPVDMMMAGNPHLHAEDIVRLRALYGVDTPWTTRYLHWLHDLLQGDLGYSRLFAAPVGEVLAARLGHSLLLLGCSLTASVLIAIPLGLLAARFLERWPDRLIGLGCFAGIALPPFWLALLLMILFSVTLGWLPAGGDGSDNGGGINPTHLILPVLTLTLASVAQYTRYLRANLADILRMDFMRTAMAKGASMPRALFLHALPHAAIPLIALVGAEFGSLFSGALITETMFAWPGIGRVIFEAIMGNDYPLALAALLLATAMTLVGNMLADSAAAWLDPRPKSDPMV